MDAHAPRHEVLFEGFSEEQILNLPKEATEILILVGEPLVFRAGSAALLRSFKVTSIRLTIERAQIEGGGEGVLVALASLARRYPTSLGLANVEWIEQGCFVRKTESRASASP